MKTNQWYLIRKKGDKRWTAYKVTADKMRELNPDFEAKGPYASLVECLIHNN